MDKEVAQEESVDDEEDAYRPVEHREIESVCSAHYSVIAFGLNGASRIRFVRLYAQDCGRIRRSIHLQIANCVALHKTLNSHILLPDKLHFR